MYACISLNPLLILSHTFFSHIIFPPDTDIIIIIFVLFFLITFLLPLPLSPLSIYTVYTTDTHTKSLTAIGVCEVVALELRREGKSDETRGKGGEGERVRGKEREGEGEEREG